MPENLPARKFLPGGIKWLAAAGSLLPPVALGLLLWGNAVNVPYWDEWDDDLAGIFLKWHAGDLHLGDLWAQHMESRLVLPRAIFLLIARGTHWNLRVEVAATFILACAAVVLIFRLGRKTFPARPITGWLTFFLVSLLIFSPAYYQAWLWGMELMLFLPLICILASLLIWQTDFSPRTKILLASLFATASTCSFSNGFLAWLVLFPPIFLAEGWCGLKQHSRAALLWWFAFFANIAVYFQNYQSPLSSGLAPGLRQHPTLIANYVFTFLGGPLTNQNSDHAVALAASIGGTAILFFAASGGLLFCQRRDTDLMRRAWPWLALGSYGILSALLAAAGRAAGGAEQALSPRYGIFGVCLLLSLIYLVPCVILQIDEKSNLSAARQSAIQAAPAVLAGAILVLQILLWPAAVANLKYFSLTLRHGKSCLRFVDVLTPPPAALRSTICPDLNRAQRVAGALAAGGIGDFAPLKSNRLGNFEVESPVANKSIGAMENGQVGGTNLFLSGWALAAAHHRPADAVVFSCESSEAAPEIFAVMDQRLIRPDLVQKFSSQEFLLAGWQKTCELNALPVGALTIKAWSFDAETCRLSPLGNEIHLDRR
jgi:hypothetical protein